MNISAIGCAVLGSEELQPEHFIILTLTIDGKELRVRAMVVRCRETMTTEGEHIYEYGLTFSGLERLHINTITKAVRQVQLHLLAAQDQKT